MSMTPAAPPPPEPTRTQSRFRWYHKMIGLLFVILCFEVGIFLVVFPWLEYWDSNFFGFFSEEWHEVWVSPWTRGAVSGLGVVNLYVSLLEVFRLQRFSDSE